jgi:lipoyl(octanoyl) transferase
MLIVTRQLGRTDYQKTLTKMQVFTAERSAETPDELWLTEHSSVYTLGLNRRNVRLPTRDDIPVVLVDRGGKITYHGIGQVIIYLLIDLTRKQMSVRQLVSLIEHCIIDLLAHYGITAVARADAPGVYVDGKKIASVGLRLKQNRTYHGLSLNVDMDLLPFSAIDPCGYAGLQMTQTSMLGIEVSPMEMGKKLLSLLENGLNKV